MQVNISGFGTSVQLFASVTFPQGITLTQAADDSDFLDSAELAIAESAQGMNGTHITWTKPAVTDITLAAIPTTDDDINLSTLHNANRLEAGKTSARDVVTLVVTYPDGSTVTLGDGLISAGQPLIGTAQTGRFKTRPFKFRFTTLSYNNVRQGA